jgi:SNF2 family DNA or RNA helicase
LSQTFKRLGIKFLSIRGGSKTTGEVVRTFNQSDEYQFLICQAKAVNYGITVLGKNPEALEGDIDGLMPEIDTRVYTHIFYSLNYSLEVFLQQQDRSHRIGQTMPVDYYILLSDCYADQAIYNALSTKMEVREATLIDISRRLKELV